MTLPPDEAAHDERVADAAVDDALRTLPQRPAPPGLAPAVLAALRAPENAQAARPVFRVGWMDLALSGFAALMLALGLLLSGWLSPQTLGPVQGALAGLLGLSAALAGLPALGGLLVTVLLVGLAALVFRRPGDWRRL
jgi:hypothetical protein